MSYNEQLHVWRLLLKNKLAGKIAPAHPWDRRKTEYALLVPDKLAVAEVNAVLDTPITVDHLPAILARFRHLDPPYDDDSREDSPKEWLRAKRLRLDRRKAYKRKWMRRKRGAEVSTNPI